MTTIYCGVCDEATYADAPTSCSNPDHDEFSSAITEPLILEMSAPSTFQVSALALQEAQSFLTNHPEFRDTYDNSRPQPLYCNTWAETLNFTSPEDYEVVTSMALPDVSPLDSEDVTSEDIWSDIHTANRSLEFRGTYRDLEPNRCTYAIAWSYQANAKSPRSTGVYATPHLPATPKTGRNRNKPWTTLSSYEQREATDYSDPYLTTKLEFQALQGMVTQKLIDLQITERYHHKLFNVYWGRDNNLHIGLLTITFDKDGNPQATCGRKDCYYHRTPYVYVPPAEPVLTTGVVDTADTTTIRSYQEAFIHNLIRHGNNHGPNFLTTRRDFTYIHASNCNTQHAWAEPCNNLATSRHFSLENPDLASVLDFLIQHRRYCTLKAHACRCTYYYHLLSAADRERQTSWQQAS